VGSIGNIFKGCVGKLEKVIDLKYCFIGFFKYNNVIPFLTALLISV